MKRIAPLLLLLCLPLVSRADEASRRAKATEIVKLLHLDRAADTMTDNLLRQVTNITMQRAGGTLTPQEQASMDEFKKKVLATIVPKVGWEAIQPEYVQRYANAFTDEELDGLLAFYKSPLGTSMLEKTPVVTQEVNRLIQERILALQPEMNRMLNEFEQTVPPKAPAGGAGPARPAAPVPNPNTSPAPGSNPPK